MIIYDFLYLQINIHWKQYHEKNIPNNLRTDYAFSYGLRTIGRRRKKTEKS